MFMNVQKAQNQSVKIESRIGTKDYEAEFRNTVFNLPQAYDKKGNKATATGKVIGPLGEVYKGADGKDFVKNETYLSSPWPFTRYTDLKGVPTHEVSDGRKGKPYSVYEYWQTKNGPVKDVMSGDYKVSSSRHFTKDGEFYGGEKIQRKNNKETFYTVDKNGKEIKSMSAEYKDGKMVKIIRYNH